ncbi:MAG: hypothetical protein ACR2JA_13170 [Hydrogenophaga sp.]|uniref:hypothetical protein n=1 Tax=Hydrogenophaga sp. TaxID=1904254 RepID=UPI003D9B1A6F
MRFHVRLWAVLITAFLLLSGCAAPRQESISLSSDFFKTGAGKIGIAMPEAPKPDTFFPGADCLLCIAAASVNHRSLTNEVQTWPTDEFQSLGVEMQALLKSQGQLAVLIAEPLKLQDLPDRKNAAPGQARKDFSSLQQRAGIDRLLVIQLLQAGVQRSHSAYFPTGPAMATLKAEAYLVDLSTHQLAWYETVDLSRSAEGNWDEAPKFPGLTNAYFQILELSKEQIKKPFVKP